MKKITFTKETMMQTLFVAFIVLVSSCGFNQKPKDTKEVAEEQNEESFDDNKKEKDEQFLVNAAEINQEEIRLGQLAQQKGGTAEVKELGKMMEDAHAKWLNDLTALAKSKMIAIPTTPTDDAKDAYNELNEESVEDFDEAYTNMMVSEHEDAIETFEKASTDCHDQDIRNWASASLPALRKHLDRAVDSQKKYSTMYLEKNN